MLQGMLQGACSKGAGSAAGDIAMPKHRNIGRHSAMALAAINKSGKG
jgi:hypothetical protein